MSNTPQSTLPLQTSLLQGKRILITGAGRGIGKRLAMGFAQQGAKVGLLSRSKPELDLTQLEIEASGGVALRLKGDVRNPDEMMIAADRMHATWGGVDGLVCAAAIQGPIGPLMEIPPQAWANTVTTNLMGVAYAARAVLPAMKDKRNGKILALSGGGAFTPRPYFTAYAATKAGLVRFVESLAAECMDWNVQANCMSPGSANTTMTDEILSAGEEKAGWKEIENARQVRLTGGSQPEKQMELACFLMSERSNHITGKVLHVNDDWKKLEKGAVNPELYTLRRLTKV